ncbi:TetR/AcrR family transcriptional regulator [Pseudobutyrivibrio ruminis]|uniref:TetR family transcriptional regulator n=1 Tax=Pseudobutyrivibrio ruminis TaxID=46206 RepID=A0A2G3DRU3_9FIRM|nr:TetR/AcrR family transcriptional regulator [Pseudobutyrivibrio ruminis]PHU33756.1 TetR family transcriptional regulator [Pseudobutyrivibrio ruminis]
MREKKNPDERKQEIIQVAGELFATNGYKKTQVKDIVQSIGVAQGLFYYYFKSKEEVMAAVAEEYAAEIINEIEKNINECENTGEKIELVFNTFISKAQKENKLFIEIQSADNSIVHTIVQSIIGKKLIPIVVSIIEQGKKNKECNCSNPLISAKFCVFGVFSILDGMGPEEKLQFLFVNRGDIERIVYRIIGLENGGLYESTRSVNGDDK